MIYSSAVGNIYYKKVGSGPHLSFLHGFCEHSGMWDAVVEELSSSYTCVLIDLPGFGESKLQHPYTMRDLAAMLHELLDDLGIPQTHLIGHSMGGYVAAEFLQHYPEQLLSLSMIHSTSYADNEDKRASREKAISFIQQYGAEPFLKQFYPLLVAPSNTERLSERLWELVKASPADAIIAATKAMLNRKDHSKTLAESTLPIFFLTGDSDQHFSTDVIFSQASKCSACQIVVLPGIGHCAPIEDAADCSQGIRTFLQFCEQLQ